MAKKGPAPKKQPQKKAASAPAKNRMRPLLIAVAVIAVAVVAIVLANNVKPQGGGSGTAGADPQEAKYMGRLLPAGYQEPKVADLMTYTSNVTMTPLTATDAGSQISVPVKDVVDARIVKFEYAKAGAKPIPLFAYVKPTGKLFVGVNFCPPCEGEGQRIETDMTLTCESCGTKRNVETGVGISGTCRLYPLDELPAKVVAGKIVIEKSALDSWTAQPKDRPVG